MRSAYEHIIQDTGNNFTLREWEPKHQNTVERIQKHFFRKICRFREWHGYATFISSALRPGDPRSHGLGLAVDEIMFQNGGWMNTCVQPLAMYHLAEMFGFKGIGLYFDWHLDAKKTKRTCGLHLDEWDDDILRPARWIRAHGEFYVMNRNDGIFHGHNSSFSLEEAIVKFWK